jgi:flagellar biosynthesis protein FlhF
MDESSNFGIILNIAKYASSKLSYVTTGQSVPDDIELLNIDRIAKKLLGSI